MAAKKMPAKRVPTPPAPRKRTTGNSGSPGAGGSQKAMSDYEKMLVAKYGNKQGFVPFSAMTVADAVSSFKDVVAESSIYNNASNPRMVMAAAKKVAEAGHQMSAEIGMRAETRRGKKPAVRKGMTGQKKR